MKIIDSLRQKNWATIFTIYLRYLIGGAFVFSAIVKIKGERFMTMDGTNYPVNSLQHFFETIYQSGLYYKFIGIAQLIASLLLMTQLFSALGAIIFYPIILNIFLITASYGFVGTPFITGLMLLANTYLLLWDYNKLKPIITKPSAQMFLKNNFNK